MDAAPPPPSPHLVKSSHPAAVTPDGYDSQGLINIVAPNLTGCKTPQALLHRCPCLDPHPGCRGRSASYVLSLNCLAAPGDSYAFAATALLPYEQQVRCAQQIASVSLSRVCSALHELWLTCTSRRLLLALTLFK